MQGSLATTSQSAPPAIKPKAMLWLPRRVERQKPSGLASRVSLAHQREKVNPSQILPDANHSKPGTLKTSRRARCLQPIGPQKLSGKKPYETLEDILMPMVGKKKYPYTKEGKAAAKKAAKKSGKKVVKKKKRY